MRAQDRRAGCNRVSLLSKVAQYAFAAAQPQTPVFEPQPEVDDTQAYEPPKPWWRKNWVLPAAIAAGGLGLGAYYGNRRGRVRGAEDTYDAFEKALTEQEQVLAGQ